MRFYQLNALNADDRAAMDKAIAGLRAAADRDDAKAKDLDTMVERAKASVTGVNLDSVIGDLKQTRVAYQKMQTRYDELIANGATDHARAVDFVRGALAVGSSVQAFDAAARNDITRMMKEVASESLKDLMPFGAIAVGVAVLGALILFGPRRK